MTNDDSNVTRPAHLPRLRNRASLGRLVVFGGVLDFEGHPSTTDRTLPSMPLIPHLYSHLAGPAPSPPSSSLVVVEPPLMQSHSKQHRGQASQHTPVKNTNSSSTLRALEALNSHQQDATKYPTSLSNGRPRTPIPRLDLDFDHHRQHKQHQSRRISNRQVDNQQFHSQSRSNSGCPSDQASVDGGSTLLDSDEDVTEELGRRISKTRIKKQREEEIDEEERLVNEIRKDMDEGGYASLEQILARNGFKVCRVATPPSTGRISSTRHTSTTQTSIEQVDSHHHHPLSKTISASSSTLTATTNTHPQAKTNSSNRSTVERNIGTIKNKSSMLSFSGIVSSFWSTSTGGQDATIIPKQTTSDPPTHAPHNENSTPTTSTPRDSEDTIGKIPAGQNDDVVVDRNEDIKGWLRQTFNASNAYMNEARRTIEAARMAMGSPEKKKNSQKKDCEMVENAGLSTMSQDTEITHEEDVQEDEAESDVNDSSLLLDEEIERRQATTSTLDSELIETPTCSPVTVNHPISSISQNTTTSKVPKANHASVDVSMCSPPLRQLNSNMEQPVINHQITYFDSPLMRKKMNRISLQTRQESTSHQQRKENHQLQQQNLMGEVVEYPPSSPDLRDICRRRQEDGTFPSENSDESQQQQKGNSHSSSAENLLRGTLRHAVTESTPPSSTSEERAERYDSVKQGNVMPAAGVKNGYRPSIASIFGIPIGFSSSSSSSTGGTGAISTTFSATTSAGVLDRKKGEQDLEGDDEGNKLKQSITDSTLSRETNSSIDTKSTSAKDTISTNSVSVRKSTSTSNSNAPKLLRKTASKYTLRKAASPILSDNSIAIYRDLDSESLDSATTVKNKTTEIKSKVHNDDFTPVKNRQSGIRGPLPIKTPSPSPSSSSSTTKTGVDSVDRKNITPRQVAHRNPRDSPIGETKVVRSPRTSLVGTTKQFVTGSQAQSAAGTPAKKTSGVGKDGRKLPAQPGIMDDENDNDGLWSPPKPSPRPATSSPKRAPLGTAKMGMQPQQQRDGNAQYRNGQQKDKNQIKPRLKAKESLERLLAYKQMQEDDSSKEIVPPVPTSAAQTQSSYSMSATDFNQAGTISSTDAVNSNTSPTASSPQVLSKRSIEETKNKVNFTLKHKSSFGGTLRGLIGSAVAGWAESTTPMMMTGDRNAPVSSQSISSSSSKRVTILPAQKPLSSTTNGKNGDSNTIRAITNGSVKGKGIRRARSMYVDHKGRRMGERDLENGSSWMSMERERNNLILPTIIISDYTQ